MKRIVLPIIACIYSLAAFCQVGGPNTMPTISNPIPLAPNAASFAKYGEIPVGLYTGIPSISVPIYTIQSGSLQLPISLSYHAAGVRVEEISSWVGLGWSLNAGGAIGRQVRGIADEGSGGYLQDYGTINRYLYGSISESDLLSFFQNIEAGIMDSQQDMFTYNVGGESGKFFFDSTGAVNTVPMSRNKFQFGTFLGHDSSWKITDINGTQYYFCNHELTIATPNSNGSLSTNPLPASITNWYMTKIVDALNRDSITFDYVPTLTLTNTTLAQTKYLVNVNVDPDASNICPTKTPDSRYSSSRVNGYQLAQINFKNGKVIFTTSPTARCDLHTEHALSGIQVVNSDGSLGMNYQFFQSYLSTTGSGCDDDEENNRMFLDSLQLTDNSGGNAQKYLFAYNKSTRLPNRRSFSQDHWGYYNGVNNQTNFVPATPLNYGGTAMVLPGANREPDSNYNRAGMLQSIRYPTGGRTEFEFETNTAYNTTPATSVSAGTRTFYMNNTLMNGRLLIDTTFVQPDSTIIINSVFGVNASITIENGNSCTGTAQIGCPLVSITGPVNVGPITQNTTHFLPVGTYHVKIDLRTVQDDDILQNFNFLVSWDYSTLQVDTLRYNTIVGGLRVRKITEYAAGNTQTNVHRYSYTMPDAPTHSSGFLLSVPEYQGTMVLTEDVLVTEKGTESYTCPFLTFSSGSNYPLASTQSSYVGYKYVQETLGENGEFGKNAYKFTAPDSVTDVINENFPYPPGTSYDWARGQTLGADTYRWNKTSGQYEIVSQKENDYQFNISTSSYIGLQIARNHFFSGQVLDGLGTSAYTVAQFQTVTGWRPMTFQKEVLYDQNNGTIYRQKTTSNVYSDIHFQPIQTTVANSNGDTSTAFMSYPLDYTGLTGTDALTKGVIALQNANIVSPVIEKYSQRRTASGSLIGTTGALLTSYKTTSLKPDTLWAPEFPKPASSFTPLAVTGGSLVKDGAYIAQVANARYDADGNLVEQQKIHDVRHTYLWDYHGTYPIVAATNTDSASIAYTSFEADGSGNWAIGSGAVDSTKAFTGHRSYALTGNISKSGLSSGVTYFVSYWTTGSAMSINGTLSGYPQRGKTILLNGASWTLYVHKVTGQSTVTVSGSGNIDELRLYPATAQMTTYTYTPLIGMTSQTDVANRTTYYEYDGLARLKRVRDQDYNILKTLEYQYQTPGGCGGGCSILAMQTLTGTPTLSYPVGVFNVNGKLLGNATTPDDYVTKWNSDTTDTHVGTLSKGADSMHFQLALNSGQSAPAGVTGCRYYQYDLPWNSLDCVIFYNGDYVDWGDGTGMRLGATGADTPAVTPPNTNKLFNPYTQTWTFTHSYPNDSLKTLTFYHSDNFKSSALAEYQTLAGHTYLQNLRGNLPQQTTGIGGSSYQQASALTVSNISNWSSISSITAFQLIAGDLVTPCEHVNYAQDFMQNNRGLNTIITTWTSVGPSYMQAGYRDTTFKLSRLKSDWNTYFTNLQDIEISDEHWNREDLSALTKLRTFMLVATNVNHSNDPTGNSLIVIPNDAIDSILNQIAAGAGQNVSNGFIQILSAGGSHRTDASKTAVQLLVNKGWYIYVNGNVD